jgi:poly-beta-hydroxyalkanoate depolymerase
MAPTRLASALDVFAHATAPRGKPAFGIRTVQVDGQTHAVHETTVVHRPFGDLKRLPTMAWVPTRRACCWWRR